jgi:heterodisulfide reductase subunit A
MTALKYSNMIRSALPDAHVYQLYADMRAFGKNCEELYTETSKKDVLFLMYDQRTGLPVVEKDTVGPGVLIRFNEKLSGEDIEVPADLVILMTAVEAREDAKAISHMTGLSLDANGFFIVKHPKLDPVATTTDGVYVVGNCQSPKNIPESVTQARAATADILATIAMGYVEVEVITADVNEEICCGCQFCIQVCPYGANHFDKRKEISAVNEVLCKGCGTCSSACPSGAITTKHFTDKQILSQIEGIMAEVL